MARELELMSRNLWDFPKLRLSSLLDDETDLLSLPFFDNTNKGLSISEDDHNVYVEAAVPGVSPDDIEVTYDQGMLRIRGQAKSSEEDKNRKYYRRSSSSFAYRIAVPGEVDSSQEPEAVYSNGLLKLTFSKGSTPEPRRIAIKSQGSSSGKNQSKEKSEE